MVRQLWQAVWGFRMRSCVGGMDDQNAKIQKIMLKQYGIDGKLAFYRSVGIDANDLYPEQQFSK